MQHDWFGHIVVELLVLLGMHGQEHLDIAGFVIWQAIEGVISALDDTAIAVSSLDMHNVCTLRPVPETDGEFAR